MGRILFGGTAALLICIFLSPKFIEFLREREFGQHIREDGPEGHHQKAGTPTMGGMIIFFAVAISFLILTELRMALGGGVRRGARVRAAGLRRRLHEARQPPLAGPAGADEAGRHDRDLAGALVGRQARGAPAGDAVAALRRLPHRPGPALPAADLPGGGGHDERGEPHRRARRPRRGLRGDRAAGLHRDRVPRRRLRPGDARRLPGRRVRRASCGSTRSRRRSSWATPARWGSAGRSPAWR